MNKKIKKINFKINFTKIKYLKIETGKNKIIIRGNIHRIKIQQQIKM